MKYCLRQINFWVRCIDITIRWSWTSRSIKRAKKTLGSWLIKTRFAGKTWISRYPLGKISVYNTMTTTKSVVDTNSPLQPSQRQSKICLRAKLELVTTASTCSRWTSALKWQNHCSTIQNDSKPQGRLQKICFWANTQEVIHQKDARGENLVVTCFTGAPAQLEQ